MSVPSNSPSFFTFLNQSRDHAFKSRAMSSLASLKREQARIEVETGHHMLVGLSLAGTLRPLIRCAMCTHTIMRTYTRQKYTARTYTQTQTHTAHTYTQTHTAHAYTQTHTQTRTAHTYTHTHTQTQIHICTPVHLGYDFRRVCLVVLVSVNLTCLAGTLRGRMFGVLHPRSQSSNCVVGSFLQLIR